ncbi:MAG: MmcQ/YjbR family DNA-binding protein [Oscillospiraceae bacterium]
MTKEDYLNFCVSIGGATVDQPFKDDYNTYCARHRLSRKWFALVLELNGKTIVNLKCDPMYADFLRGIFKSISPAYHMNKRKWISVELSGDVPEKKLRALTIESFELTAPKIKLRK